MTSRSIAACVCAVLVLVSQKEEAQATSRKLSGEEIDAGLVEASQCPSSNQLLSQWLRTRTQQVERLLPYSAKAFEEFLVELKGSVDSNNLTDRPIKYVMAETSPFSPTCSGDWMEFGVFNGDTINLAASSRRRICGDVCPPVFGFDTFTGLPEDWVRDETDQDFGVDGQGTFNLEGKFPTVEPNVQLVKGKFHDMLPLFELQHQQHVGKKPVSFLHIDCDLYNGTVDVLSLLNNRITVGTVIIFDELINYRNYREHEVKALWEWLEESGAKLATLGALGPLAGESHTMDLIVNQPNGEHPWFQQSVAFVVAKAPKPNMPPLMANLMPSQATETKQLENDANAEHKIKDATDREVAPVEMLKDDEEEEAPVQTVQEAAPVNLDDHPVLDEKAAAEQWEASSTEGKKEITAADVESVVPLDELEADPEGEVQQDQLQKNKRPRPLKLTYESPADSVTNLVQRPEASVSKRTHHRETKEEVNEGKNAEGAENVGDSMADLEERKRQQREADEGGPAGAQIAEQRADTAQDVIINIAEDSAENPGESEELDQRKAAAQDKAKQKRKGRKHRGSLDEGSSGTLQTAH